jgi:NAD dependent epimerase/dehydratase family enzyme
MRIAITGATGMIGSRLVDFFVGKGCAVTVFTRNSSYQHPGVSVAVWDPALSYIEAEDLEGFDVIIHLAGSNIVTNWSARHKKEILDSRVASTKLLCESLTQAASGPKLFICASAIGFYGNHPPQEILDENSPSGRGFLADV